MSLFLSVLFELEQKDTSSLFHNQGSFSDRISVDRSFVLFFTYKGLILNFPKV